MNETLSIVTERVDDIPLLVAQMRRMELPALIDSSFVAHGNRAGLSLGWTATVWLAHILSQGDHRLNQVQPWAERLCWLVTSSALESDGQSLGQSPGTQGLNAL